jgi:bacterioferritin-associated ferredoxin
MVTRCVCFDVSFERLKALALAEGITDIEALGERIEFGQNCGLCLPYIRLMLETGDTAFAVLGED